jgi:gas vesicle protein
MNPNKDAKLLSALALVMAIALAPVSTAAFAQTYNADAIDFQAEVDANVSTEADVEVTDENTETARDITDEMKDRMKQLKDQRAEKIRDMKERLTAEYKDRVRPDLEHVVRPYDIAPDRKPDLYFKGQVDGWSLIGGFAYESSTSLEGEAYHVRGSVWKVHVTDGQIEIGKRMVTIEEMKGYAKGNHLALRGVVNLSEEVQVNIGLAGHFAPTKKSGEFALALTKLWYNTDQNSGRIHLAQVGEVHIRPNVEISDAVPIPEPAPSVEPEIFG